MRPTLLFCIGILLVGNRPTISHADFIIDIQPSTTLASNTTALDAFRTAADRWSAIFNDNITMRIAADFTSLGAGVLGQASTAIIRTNYSTASNAMIADAAPYPDNALVAALPTSPTFIAPSGVTVDSNLTDMSRANAKALGLVNATHNSLDATITFNSDFNFDFDPSDGIDSNAFDFVAIAAHEIGHAMGFISSVDFVDGGATEVVATTLDLFRFEDNTANDPATLTDFTNFSRSLSPGVEANFDEISDEYRMATGLTGDGTQASHWKDNLGIGLLDPTLAMGELGVITEADIRSFDLIGWDRIAAVPEPSSLIAFGLAAIMGLFTRRRRFTT